MKKLIVFALFLFLFGASYSAEISGAFGIKLGEKIDNQPQVKIIKEDKEKNIIIIDPPKKLSFLDAYLVNITPKTRLVSSIVGVKLGLEPSECEDLLKTLKLKLEKKYNIQFKEELSMDTVFTAIKNGKAINIRCEKDFKDLKYVANFGLIYLDIKTKELEEKEKLEDKAKEIDDSGL